MPITFDQIANNTASVTIKPTADPEATLTITFYPGHITEEVFAQLSAISKAAQTQDEVAGAFEKLNELLCPLIESWDAYEDADSKTMIPITPERFKKLPIPFRMKVLNAIMDSFNPE